MKLKKETEGGRERWREEREKKKNSEWINEKPLVN